MGIRIGESALSGEICQIYDFAADRQQNPSASPVTSAAKRAEQYSQSSYSKPDGTNVRLNFQSILDGKKQAAD